VEKEIEEGQATSEKFLEIIKDTVLLDCPLSDLGITQSQEAQPLANSLIGIKTVLISPLRRAL
jgi:broad specificity phosphatase PhoE